MKKIGWRIIPIVFFLVLSLFLWRGLYLDPHQLPSVQIGKAVPQFDLGQLQDTNLHFDSKLFKHKVVLLNVWASWCEACIEEQVLMMKLAREGVLIFGLNYKDQNKDALEWLQQWGNPYQLIGADKDGKVGIDLGVYGAPETFVIDKKGIIRYRHVGILTEAVWLKTVYPLINQLEKEA